MKGKKLILLAMAIMLLLAIPTAVFAVKSDAKSNTNPPTKVTAKFEFNITGPDELTITGTAKGLSPGKAYHSAVYGVGSSVKGVNSCKRADSVGGSMGLGNWSAVTAAGTATLLKVTDPLDLDKITTVSVRSGPAGDDVPGGSIVLSCGKVK